MAVHTIVAAAGKIVPPSRGRVGHTERPECAVKHEAVAVIHDWVEIVRVTGQEIAVDRRPLAGGAGLKVRAPAVDVVDEEAVQRVRGSRSRLSSTTARHALRTQREAARSRGGRRRRMSASASSRPAELGVPSDPLEARIKAKRVAATCLGYMEK